MSWNINGGLEKKLNDAPFINFISTYDIIFLTECWIEKDFDFPIPGFTCKFIPRSLSKSKQGGGMALCFRNE